MSCLVPHSCLISIPDRYYLLWFHIECGVTSLLANLPRHSLTAIPFRFAPVHPMSHVCYCSCQSTRHAENDSAAYYKPANGNLLTMGLWHASAAICKSQGLFGLEMAKDMYCIYIGLNIQINGFRIILQFLVISVSKVHTRRRFLEAHMFGIRIEYLKSLNLYNNFKRKLSYLFIYII